MCEGKDIVPTFLQLATMSHHGIPKFAIERTKQHKLCNVPILVQHSFVFTFVIVNCHDTLANMDENLLFD